jgi:NAD(P)H-dependent FMN reductase
MKLAIFNGSPRRKNSNSTILLDRFINGFNRISDYLPTIHYVADTKLMNDNLEAFDSAEYVLIIFPLYTDCMPGVVKEFFEKICERKMYQSKKIGFIVQSGFPEIIHSVWVEKYLQKLVNRLNCDYLGTVIKGGVEGIKIMPPIMTKKLYKNFEMLGEYFANHQEFSPKIKAKLAKPYKMSYVRISFFKLFKSLGFTNFYWNMNLKKNEAFEKRYDRPYDVI